MSRFLCPRRFAVAVTGVILALITACSSATPEIMQVQVRLVSTLDASTGQIQERLSVFADVFDADGAGEIETVRVSYPDLGLEWVLSGATLTPIEQDGQRWYGAAALRAPGWTTLPRGRLAVEVVDLSGRAARRDLVVPPVTSVRAPGEFARIIDGEMHLPPGVTSVQLSAPDGRLQELSVPPATDRLALEDLAEVPAVLTLLEGDWYLILARSEAHWLESGPWPSPLLTIRGGAAE